MDNGGNIKKKVQGRKGGGTKKKSVSWYMKAGLKFHSARIGCYLKKGRYSQRVGTGAPVYLDVVLEYLTIEVLELAGNVDNKKSRIIPRHVMLTMRNDEELEKLLAGVIIDQGGIPHNINLKLLWKNIAEKVNKEPQSPCKATKMLGPQETQEGGLNSILKSLQISWKTFRNKQN